MPPLRHLLPITCCIFFACCQSAAQATSPQTPPAKTNLRCYVNVDAALISRAKPVHARVDIENGSLVRKTLTRMTVYLEEQPELKPVVTSPGLYYAPVDIVRGSALLPKISETGIPVYPEREVTLDASKEITLSLDLKELRWAQDISSAVPYFRLFPIVPDGKYLLYVEVRSAGGETVRSRKTEVTIARKGPG